MGSIGLESSIRMDVEFMFVSLQTILAVLADKPEIIALEWKQFFEVSFG